MFPFALSEKPEDRLTVVEWIFHRTSKHVFHSRDAVREIPAIVQSVQYLPSEGQSFYNRQLSRYFVSWDWQRAQKAIPELPLKCDFIKNNVQVEVEFGNARTYYQDYIKDRRYQGHLDELIRCGSWQARRRSASSGLASRPLS